MKRNWRSAISIAAQELRRLSSFMLAFFLIGQVVNWLDYHRGVLASIGVLLMTSYLLYPSELKMQALASRNYR